MPFPFHTSCTPSDRIITYTLSSLLVVAVLVGVAVLLVFRQSAARLGCERVVFLALFRLRIVSHVPSSLIVWCQTFCGTDDRVRCNHSHLSGIHRRYSRSLSSVQACPA